MARYLHGLLLVLCLGLSPPPGAAANAPSAVQDLQYGEVLFHFYQQDYFNSIVRLQIAREQERLPHHAGEAELLLGGLDLSYGLRDAADDIFQRLLTGDSAREAQRNRAWFYMAKISWQRGDTARALKALAQVKGRMSAATRNDALHLQSLALLQLGRNEEAIEVLQDTQDSADWSPYLIYNLGVAQIRNNRLAEGTRQLEHIGELNAHSEELRLLRDKANLALGYSYLQHGEVERSRQALERVRLEGPLSSKALLGTGWADTELEAYGRALVPWTELESRSVTDPAVQEVLLAIPFAMTKLDLHGRAVQHYEQAITTLREEQHKLDESIEAIRNGELLDALRDAPPGTGNGWLQPLAMITGSPVLRYQVQLMASHDFQEAVKNYRDLQALQNNLDHWADSIEAYDDMLASREARFAKHRPAVVAVLQDDAVLALEQRHTRLANALARIEADDDPVGLASAQELRQWQRLEAIKTRLGELPESAQLSTLRDKQRRLQGLLYWQLNADFKPRLWRAKQQLKELDARLVTTRHARETLQHADLDAPGGFEGFSRRIALQKQAIRDLQARTLQTQQAQGTYLELLAVKELEQQKRRVATYLVEARFAMAQTFDSALNTVTDPAGKVVP